MVLTVSQAFDKFKSTLELTRIEQLTASIRHRSVRDRIASKIELKEDFLTGSYKRETKIRPLNDIDLFIVLDPKYVNVYFYNKHPRIVLSDLKHILRKLYPRTPIRLQNRSINLLFADFGFDIVPSFHRQGGGFLIPDLKKRMWISTNPKAHDDLVTEANKKANNNLKPVIKIIKWWNNKRNLNPLSSFHIEVLAMDILKTPITSLQLAVTEFFIKATDLIKKPCYDPVGLSGQIDDYLTLSRKRVISHRMLNCAEKSLRALKFENNENHLRAKRIWRLLLGHSFPIFK